MLDTATQNQAVPEAFLKALVSALTGAETPCEDESETGAAVVPESRPTVCLADIAPAAPRWLWRGRIPNGRLTCLLGPKGSGKSFLALDIAARVTRGAPWPDAPDQPGVAGSVLLVTAQDQLAETIVPRLIAAGADLSKVHALGAGVDHRGEPRRFNLLEAERLERAIEALPDLKLVVIDPVNAFLGYGNDRRDLRFANVLRRLERYAERHGIAVLLVNATDRGSIGRTWQFGRDILPELNEASRAVWSVSEDPLDRDSHLFLPVRINLAAEPAGLRFVIDRESGALAWSAEPVELRGDDVPRGNRSESDVARATTWLRAFLADGAQPAETVLREGAVAGHSRRALYAAKTRLRVRSAKGTDRFAGAWTWEPHREEFTTLVRRFEHHGSGASAPSSTANTPATPGGTEHGEDSNITAPSEPGLPAPRFERAKMTSPRSRGPRKPHATELDTTTEVSVPVPCEQTP